MRKRRVFVEHMPANSSSNASAKASDVTTTSITIASDKGAITAISTRRVRAPGAERRFRANAMSEPVSAKCTALLAQTGRTANLITAVSFPIGSFPAISRGTPLESRD